MKNNKQELREFYLNNRRALNEDYLTKAQEIIDKKVINYLYELQPKAIGIYYSIAKEKEVDTTVIINYCLDNNIKVYLPKWDDKSMDFYQINNESDLITFNDYYMPNTDLKLTDNDVLDIMFVPLVAFDKNNHRLGYGKGYYDKWLNNHQSQIKELIGLAWKDQLTKEEIIVEEHDIPLNRVIIN